MSALGPSIRSHLRTRIGTKDPSRAGAVLLTFEAPNHLLFFPCTIHHEVPVNITIARIRVWSGSLVGRGGGSQRDCETPKFAGPQGGDDTRGGRTASGFLNPSVWTFWVLPPRVRAVGFVRILKLHSTWRKTAFIFLVISVKSRRREIIK